MPSHHALPCSFCPPSSSSLGYSMIVHSTFIFFTWIFNDSLFNHVIPSLEGPFMRVGIFSTQSQVWLCRQALIFLFIFRTMANKKPSALSLLINFGEGFEGWVGNFSVTSAPRYLTHVSGLVPRYSPIPKPFRCGCALEYLFLCTSEHSHFHFQGLHHPHQPHPNTLSPYNQQALKLSHTQLVSAFIAMAFSSLFSSRCLWYWMLKSSSLVRSIHCTAINLDISRGASHPSSWPLLPLISFKTLQSIQCFIVQNILQISSIVLDIIKTISISPRRTIPIISLSPRTSSEVASCPLPPKKFHFSTCWYI